MKWRNGSLVKGAIPKENLPSLLCQLQASLKSDSLVTGFHATEISPLNRNEALKRLPEINKYTGDDKTLIILNESVLDLLKDNLRMGPGKNEARKKRLPKVLARKQITALPTSTSNMVNVAEEADNKMHRNLGHLIPSGTVVTLQHL